MVIVILGILATVAMPAYHNIVTEAQQSACRSSLCGLREAISIFNTNSIVNTGNNVWPDLDTISTVGVVIQFSIPENPFQDEANAPDSIVEGFTRGVIVGTRGGWAYKPSTGEIWPNTSTTIPGGGCAGPTDIDENLW
ncbi:MAG: hypothetical protein GY865_04555 [candidate division Zixibacteria bacterium]|nr:hypothetical protein [candidate division Zixibacteria bacterium]